jgi:penicillin-binding protein 1A
MGGPKGSWSPENYDHKFYGPTRLREALTYSRNVVTVKLVDTIGIDNLMNFARTVGIQGEIPRNLSVALGSFNITPFEIAMVYNVFASNGMKMKPISIKYVTDRKGRVLETNEPAAEQAISPQTAFLITSMMEDVVKYGTGWRAKSLGVPVAGKTGTTNDYKDAWFVGYTSNLVASVWVGFDNSRPLGSMETGARAASPIWASFMAAAVHGEAEAFSQPEGIVAQAIDPKSGLLSRDDSGLREFFKEGTQPKQISPSKSVWEIKDPSQFNFD